MVVTLIPLTATWLACKGLLRANSPKGRYATRRSGPPFISSVSPTNLFFLRCLDPRSGSDNTHVSMILTWVLNSIIVNVVTYDTSPESFPCVNHIHLALSVSDVPKSRLRQFSTTPQHSSHPGGSCEFPLSTLHSICLRHVILMMT